MIGRSIEKEMESAMNRRIYIAVTGLAALLATGCTVDKSGDEKWEDPFFRPPQTQSNVTRIFKTATNTGAMRDATLQAMHFDGTELNETGQAKVDAIIEGHKPGTPIKVFLDLPKNDPQLLARQTALNVALVNAGIPGELFEVAIGTNPTNTSDSAMVLGSEKGLSGGTTSNSSSGTSAGTSSGNIAN